MVMFSPPGLDSFNEDFLMSCFFYRQIIWLIYISNIGKNLKSVQAKN